MKKLFLISAFFAVNFPICFAQTSMELKNPTSCGITVQFYCSHSSCADEISISYSVAANSSINFTDPTALTFSYGGGSVASTDTWDYALVTNTSGPYCPGITIGPSGGCGSYATSGTFTCG